MSLVAVAGAKSAAGITTTATALAAVWPSTAILADCDPAGGDLALRLRADGGGWLARDVGVVGLAAAARMQAGELNVEAQLQMATGGLPVLAGVDSPAQALRIDALWSGIGAALARVPGMDVVADCGRLLPGQPNEHVIAHADLVVLVARATPESVAHLRKLLEAVIAEEAGPSVHVAVIATPDTGERDVDDVRSALSSSGLPELAVNGIAHDPTAAAGLSGTPTRRLDRSALVASARELASDLNARLHLQVESSVSTPERNVGSPVEVG